MKALWLSMIASLLMLGGCTSFHSNQGCCGLPPCPTFQKSCQCLDPACFLDNPCLSHSRCCRYFGNVGSLTRS